MTGKQQLIERSTAPLGEIQALLAEQFIDAAHVLAPNLDDSQLGQWCDHCMDLASRSPRVASAFMLAAPQVLPYLEADQLASWADRGSRLYGGSWKSIGLAESFFAGSARLFAILPAQAVFQLADILRELSLHSIETAARCLTQASTLRNKVPQEVLTAFLDLGMLIARNSWIHATLLFEKGPTQLAGIAANTRSPLLVLIHRICTDTREQPHGLLTDLCDSLAEIDTHEHHKLVDPAVLLALKNPAVAAEFLRSAGVVRKRLSDLQSMTLWLESGLALLEVHGDKTTQAYFRIDSAYAEEILSELSGSVQFESVAGVLQLYGKALGGDDVRLHITGVNDHGRYSQVQVDDGEVVYLPPAMDDFGDRRANLQAYKVSVAHQTGHFTFGSFGYRYGDHGHYLKSSTSLREKSVPAGIAGVSNLQRFLALFPERLLMEGLLALVEDARVEVCLVEEYPGLSRSLRRVQRHAVEQRPELQTLGLRQAFIENLLRASLACPEAIRWPRCYMATLAHALGILGIVRNSDATVQDSVEAAALLYDISETIPNVSSRLAEGIWIPGQATDIPYDSSLSPVENWPDGIEMPFELPQGPLFRGEFNAETVRSSASPDLGKAGESSLDAPLESVEEPEEEADLEAIEAGLDAGGTDTEVDEVAEDESADVEWSYYDEWDFRANDYRSGWCRLGQRPASPGDLDYYDETLHRYHNLVSETRYQFELLRPEVQRKLKRLDDGHEIDLDQAIEFQIDKKAGAGPSARFYTRRDKVERSVAVALLLDMSGSTDEALDAREPLRSEMDGPARIIDIEKEATVLMIEALEAIGDAYGVYGFSGYGRNNVEFHVIKELDEKLDDVAKGRVGQIEPMRSTRMGAAIRHARAKLIDYPAKVRILMLVSDGRPQDLGYGREPSEREYAIRDTRQALIEGKVDGIVPFLITVDAEGHEYMKEMCPDISYEVIADISSLPRRLPAIYADAAR